MPKKYSISNQSVNHHSCHSYHMDDAVCKITVKLFNFQKFINYIFLHGFRFFFAWDSCTFIAQRPASSFSVSRTKQTFVEANQNVLKENELVLCLQTKIK